MNYNVRAPVHFEGRRGIFLDRNNTLKRGSKAVKLSEEIVPPELRNASRRPQAYGSYYRFAK